MYVKCGLFNKLVCKINSTFCRIQVVWISNDTNAGKIRKIKKKNSGCKINSIILTNFCCITEGSTQVWAQVSCNLNQVKSFRCYFIVLLNVCDTPDENEVGASPGDIKELAFVNLDFLFFRRFMLGWLLLFSCNALHHGMCNGRTRYS